MKKFLETITGNKLMQLLLFALAVMTSGAVSMAIAADATNPVSGATDPGNHPAPGTAGTPTEGIRPDSPEKGLEQPAHAATGSAVEQIELNESHLDDYVSKFKAYRFPLHTDILRKAKQIKVDVKNPTNWEVGEAVMECVTIGAINSTGAKEESVVIGQSQLAKADWKLLRKNATVMVGAALGVNIITGVSDSTPLILFVEGRDSSGVTVRALNGPWKSSEDHTPTVPAIPAGTTLFPMAPAMSESEVEVEPNNAFPTETQCFLQKKVCAITYTELFERIKKKAQWNVQDIKDYILEMFRRECTRSMLISAPAMFYKYNEKTGTEACYTENGILRQLRLGYELADGQIEFEDMIGMQAMMCGKYDTPNELTAYCGTKFIQRLLNINFEHHKEYTVRNYTDETTKIKITSFESNFGKFNFVHEYGLDDLGYSECAIIFSVEEAKHFYYQKGKTININHEKGEGGEVREAKTQYYIKDDCVKLDGFNSMIVGPAALIGGYRLSALDKIIKSVAKLSEVSSPAEGDIVYVTQDNATDAEGKLGLYEYVSYVEDDTTLYKWVTYNGKSIYVA